MEKALLWLIDVLKDLVSRRKMTERDTHFLATKISFLLNRVLLGCRDVVCDNGLYQGERDLDGCLRSQAIAPSFQLGFPDSELKLLPKDIMYRIMDLPNNIDDANSWIEGASEHAFPPDFEEFFEERQYQYAKLGLSVLNLVSDLKSFAKLPDDQDSAKEMIFLFENRKIAIENARSSRELAI